MKVGRLMMVAFGLAMVVGCSHTKRGEPAPWLAEALSAHRLADLHLKRGEVDAARQALVRLIDSPSPKGMATADERAVRQDALFRLADVELSEGRFREALGWTDRGLALGDWGDLFTANLYLGRGQALERLGRDAEAAAAYHRALLINEGLLSRALGEEGSPT